MATLAPRACKTLAEASPMPEAPPDKAITLKTDQRLLQTDSGRSEGAPCPGNHCLVPFLPVNSPERGAGEYKEAWLLIWTQS